MTSLPNPFLKNICTSFMPYFFLYYMSFDILNLSFKFQDEIYYPVGSLLWNSPNDFLQN